MSMDIVQPLCEVIEALSICQIEHEDHADRGSEVRLRNRAKTLLAGRVPYLKLDRRPVDVDICRNELDADRTLGLAGECVVDEASQNRRLTDAARTNNNELEYCPILLIHPSIANWPSAHNCGGLAAFSLTTPKKLHCPISMRRTG